ncbi:MAG: thiolase family protein [Dehalococcoidia bacterium]|uniref:thiolase family protein n=1 Tax=Candidatus Amarobacter glycogenicus TaxID=3140699 RepID=UPI002A0C4673|nr:thiolase family protein [Dehalococcoidia bacterium]MBK7126284.1 thiolase family protein [Dehalococcoidia bacterium]MBK7329740.1 thiolase family protein [Dehalococcoidia bacterium]MBK8560422.1 thiolase family protein [Dehalococcoidia bacterium]MBK9342947.1 thiolase family protein [Dehalococcoidia bacterium]
MQLQNAVIVDGARSAFGRGGRGKLVATRLDEVGAQVVRALLERNPKVDPALIEDIAMGNVGGAGELAGIGADTIARLAGLPAEISAVDSNRQCGSSMETLHRVAQSIMVGATEAGIAIGAERMGRSLGGGPRGTATRITEFNQKRLKQTDVQRNMAANHFQDFSVPFPDEILDYSPVLSMTQTAQNAAEVYGLSREDMDQFSVDSHKKAVAAYEKGIYKDEIIPLEVEEPVFDAEGNWVEAERGKTIIFDRDECIRPGTNMETLGSLPAIKGVVSPTGQEIRITAGNSCPTNDGFSAALIMSEKKALELGLTPLARIVGFGIAGVKPQVMGLGPIPSTRKALRHAGITADQIDRVEFNEAFAAQVIPSCKELGIPLDRVNVNGGSIALGHPLGATGARLVLAVAHELRRSGGRYGLATQCIGAGMGISTIIERM